MAIKPIGAQREYMGQGSAGGIARPGVQSITPAMPAEGSGLAEYGRGLASAADIVGLFARGYREAQTEKVDEELLNVDRQFNDFRQKWQSENQGKNASQAGEVFKAKHDELSKAALEHYDGEKDEIFEGLLGKRLAQQNLNAQREGQAYERRELEQYRQGQWQGQLASFARLAAENPEDAEGLAQEAASLLGSWQAKNPGKDPTAQRLQLEELAQTTRLETLLAQGKLEEARACLAQGLAGNQRREAGFSRPVATGAGGVHAGQPGRGHSIAEDLCNPLNLKKVGATSGGRDAFQAFASDADGFRAAWRQLKIYQHGKRKLQTPRQMIAVWAPASDGNNQQVYNATTSRAGGIDVDAAINIDDPMAAARLIKGMATIESPLGSRYSVEQIAGFLMGENPQELPGENPEAGKGAMPKPLLGIDPMKAARYQKQIDELERRQKALQVEDVKEPVRQFLAKCKAGVVPENLPFTEGELVEKMGEQGIRLHRQMQEEYQCAIEMSQVSQLTLQEQAQLLEQRKPQAEDPDFILHRELYERLGQTIERDRKQREADPVAYALGHDEITAQAWQDFAVSYAPDDFNNYIKQLKTAYAVRGMEPKEGEPLQVINKVEADQLARRINASDNPAEQMRNLQAGCGDYFNLVMDQVAPKLGQTAVLLASGVPDDAASLLMQARRNPNFSKEAEQALGWQSGEKASFDDEVTEALADITATFAQSGNLPFAASLRENVSIYAKQLMLVERLDADDAVERAANELILDRYHIEEAPSGARYRIPKDPSIDADKIPDQLKTWLNTLDLDEIKTKFPGQNFAGQKRMLRQALKREANFINNYDETGLILCFGPFPVYDKDNFPVQITWQELARLK